MPAPTLPSTAATALDDLLAIAATPRVSLVMAITDAQQDTIRGRGLAARARALLDDHGVAPGVADAIQGHLHDLLAGVHPVDHHHQGLACYATPDDAVRHLLPRRPPDLVAAGGEFHVLPLIDVADPIHCFVLALARGGNELWRVDRTGVRPIGLDKAPETITDITQYREMEKQLQLHATARGGAAMFHGHQESADREIEPVRMYFRGIDAAVRHAVEGGDAPVILVGPGNLPAIYREVSALGSRLGDIVETHPDALDEAGIEAIAAPVLQSRIAARTAGLLERVGTLRSTRRSSTIGAEILVAARSGRVATLLVDPATDDASLANRAAVATIRHGGEVIPAPDLVEGIGAIYRW